jgi:prephenate dehydrogenase
VADPDLFEGRPWVRTPGPRSGADALARAEALVELCRAELVVTTPARHDVAVALVSHAPQVVASLMAAQLAEADADLVGLAGPGIRDVTRVAGSDPQMWTSILTSNAAAVLPVLDAFAGDLERLRASLRRYTDESSDHFSDMSTSRGEETELTRLLTAGVRGRGRLPGKHGGRPTAYAVVQVVVSDQPGQLARLFTTADEAAVNIEDVTIEHAAGHPVGVVELMVAPEAAPTLVDALRERGWSVHV